MLVQVALISFPAGWTTTILSLASRQQRRPYQAAVNLGIKPASFIYLSLHSTQQLLLTPFALSLDRHRSSPSSCVNFYPSSWSSRQARKKGQSPSPSPLSNTHQGILPSPNSFPQAYIPSCTDPQSATLYPKNHPHQSTPDRAETYFHQNTTPNPSKRDFFHQFQMAH